MVDLLPLSPDQGQAVENAQSAFSQATGHNRIEAQTNGNVENSADHPPNTKNDTADLRQKVGGGDGLDTIGSEAPYHTPVHDVEARDHGNLDATAIYNGRQLLGSVFDLGCGYAAELADGTGLGSFPNRRVASDAIFAAARHS